MISVLNQLVRCESCGEHFYRLPNVNDNRCESCWTDEQAVKARHWEG